MIIYAKKYYKNLNHTYFKTKTKPKPVNDFEIDRKVEILVLNNFKVGFWFQRMLLNFL